MLIAVASTNGETVNEHFGKATRFWIFDITGSQQSLIMVRNVQSLSTGDKDHPFDSGRMGDITSVLQDCKRLYCTKIGDRPRHELEKLGINPVICRDPISAIRI